MHIYGSMIPNEKFVNTFIERRVNINTLLYRKSLAKASLCIPSPSSRTICSIEYNECMIIHSTRDQTENCFKKSQFKKSTNQQHTNYSKSTQATLRLTRARKKYNLLYSHHDTKINNTSHFEMIKPDCHPCE